MADQVQELAQTVTAERVFDEWSAEQKAAGRDMALWLRAKHKGFIQTYIRDGVHYVAPPVTPSNPPNGG